MNSVIKYILLACMALYGTSNGYIFKVSALTKIMPDGNPHIVVLCHDIHKPNEPVCRGQADDFGNFYRTLKATDVPIKVYTGLRKN